MLFMTPQSTATYSKFFFIFTVEPQGKQCHVHGLFMGLSVLRALLCRHGFVKNCLYTRGQRVEHNFATESCGLLHLRSFRTKNTIYIAPR